MCHILVDTIAKLHFSAKISVEQKLKQVLTQHVFVESYILNYS